MRSRCLCEVAFAKVWLQKRSGGWKGWLIQLINGKWVGGVSHAPNAATCKMFKSNPINDAVCTADVFVL